MAAKQKKVKVVVRTPKKAKKLSALTRTKREVVNLQGQLNISEGRIRSITNDNDQKSKSIAEKNARIAEIQEEVARCKVQTAQVTAERERIIRLVDQFTSISIVAQSAAVSFQSTPTHADKLRRT